MSDVQLLIKSPSYNEDFRLQLSLAATVKELKERIAQEHPSRPPVDRQRFIFAGRLLQDTDALKDILRLHDLTIPQTFHLVLKTEFAATNNAAQAPPQQPVYNQPFNQGAPNPYLFQQMQMHLGQVPGAYMVPGYAPQPGQNPYYNQYPHPGPYPGQYGPAYQQRVVLQGQMNPFQQIMMAQQQQQQRRHVRVININVSLVFKLLLMVYVLSQGGTTQRTLFLAVGAVVIYLYQTGLLPMRAVNIVPGVPQPPNNNANNNNGVPNNNVPNPNPAANNNNNVAPNANNNNNNVPPNNNVPNNALNDQAANDNVNNNAPNPNLPVPYRQPPGLWGELHGFFVPFFYSLFPSWNPDDVHGVLQQHMQDQDEGENPAAQLNR